MEKDKLSNLTMTLMLTTAGFFDLIQFLVNFIPFLGQYVSYIVDIFALVTFYVWYKILGRNFSGLKRMATTVSTVIIEIIPLLSSLPAWTAMIFILNGIEKTKEISSKVISEKVPMIKLAGKGRIVGRSGKHRISGQPIEDTV